MVVWENLGLGVACSLNKTEEIQMISLSSVKSTVH